MVVKRTIPLNAANCRTCATAPKATQLGTSTSGLFQGIHQPTCLSFPCFGAPQGTRSMHPPTLPHRQQATNARKAGQGTIRLLSIFFSSTDTGVIIATHVAKAALPRILPQVAFIAWLKKGVPSTKWRSNVVRCFCTGVNRRPLHFSAFGTLPKYRQAHLLFQFWLKFFNPLILIDYIPIALTANCVVG